MTLFGNNLHQVHSKDEILENTRTCHCNLQFEYTVCVVTITKHHVNNKYNFHLEIIRLFNVKSSFNMKKKKYWCNKFTLKYYYLLYTFRKVLHDKTF